MNYTLILPAGTKYWFDRTPEQIRNLRALDEERRQDLDSAGEPKVYCVTTCRTTKEDVVATVTKKRGVSWNSWHKKPSYLIEAITTIEGMPKIIKIRDPQRTK